VDLEGNVNFDVNKEKEKKKGKRKANQRRFCVSTPLKENLFAAVHLSLWNASQA
jgi:hypothetical protein